MGMGRAPEAPIRRTLLVSGPPMSRRSLRPQLNQIRGWVRQGRTDAWIAHQLEVTVQQIQAFKREQGLEPGADPDAAGALADYDDEIDLRASDDALIAAELEAAAAEAPDEEDEDAADEAEDEEKPARRRRGRRGGRGGAGGGGGGGAGGGGRRRKSTGPLEAT